MAEIPQGRNIIRGDNLAGGIIEQGIIKIWERWEIRELKKHIIEVYSDEHVSPELYRDDKLVRLLPTPTYINLN